MRGMGRNKGGADKDQRSDFGMDEATKDEQERLFREAREIYDNQQNVGASQQLGFGGGMEQQPNDPVSANVAAEANQQI